MICEQCGGRTSAYIWSDDAHFPGVYMCSKCVRQPNRKSAMLARARRPRGWANLSDFTQGKSPKQPVSGGFPAFASAGS